MSQKKRFLLLLGLLVVAGLILVACAPAPAEEEEAAPAEEEEEVAPAEEEEEVAPAEEEEEAALGSEENPIIWAFVPSGEVERVAAGGEAVADLLYEETGLFFTTYVATDYPSVIEALCSDPPEAHMASLATFSYVVAADRGCAEAALLSVRYGSPTYNGQFITRADSGITSIEDIAAAEGLTWCRSEPFSTSGWVIPSIMMGAAGIDPATHFAEIVDTGSHESVVAGVYDGTCDVGATYVDARTRVEEDYPDVMDVIVVIAIEPDIPNDGVQFVTGFPEDLQQQIVDGLLAIAATEDGQEALNTAYQWTDLTAADDTAYDAFRQILQASGIDPLTLLED